MFITKPQDRLSLLDTENEYLFDMHNDSARFYIENHNAQLSDKQYKHAQDIINENTELNLSIDHVKIILSLYPRTRIQFAIYEDSSDLLFAVSHLFLGCSWPTYGDKVDIDQFVTLLKTQAKKIFPDINDIETDND